ncbi:glycosyltransferase [Deinococcus radiotolerans]|uniref:Glycosyl transferase n=1 Tax=Deinococcus radiotolerans TaxID=1309407 RepID=A0ABQ2FRN0_9DEIO|nr:nucleotide disphospho-sugar-binding domain-containing protein [Deinococcus radiotolerans]GGL20163.1 glycosyl transferase [Deinococcus radiotolerans]
MARILIASQPIAGHVLPLAPVVRELRARGHAVRWYTGRKYAAHAEAAGAPWEPFVHARDYDDAAFGAAFPGRDERRGLRQLLFDVQHIFVGQIEGQLQDLRELARTWPHDVVLADQTVAAALLHEELGGPPCALLGVLPLGIPSRDTAPFGLGVPPARSALGPLRNRILTWGTRLLFAPVSRDLSALCRRLGLPGRAFAPPVAPSLMLQPTVPAFEYPRSDLPPHLQFIGPLIPEAPGRALPAWWPEVQAATRPVVMVTQGTLATDPRHLILPTLNALEGEDVLVIAAGVRPEDLPGPPPPNARVTPFVPFSQVLPHVSVYVSNGGYGGVQQALTSGVPCVVGGGSEDKVEVAARVAHAGVGVNLKTARPTPEQVRRAVRRVLQDDRVRNRAAAMGAELRAHDAPREAADLIERLLPGTGRA